MTKLPPRSLALVLFAVAAACAKHSGSVAGLVAGTPPRFETRTEISTGVGTHSDYRVADFNGDGVLDMAVISLTGELRILLGDGTSFVGAQEQQIGGVPSWIAGGDFDSDGDQDLVIVRSGADSTDLWLNDGAGTFSPSGSILGQADSVTVGDLNGDGNLDIAVARPGADDLTVAFGDGTGNFSSQTLVALPGGGKAFSPVIGDLDRDGIGDLAVADPINDRVVIYRGSNYSNFGTEYCELLVPGAPGGLVFGDLSGDGQTDLVVSAFNANRYVVITQLLGSQPQVQGGGGGVFGNPCNYQSFNVQVPARPSLATVGDVTGDGVNDLVACLAFNATMCIAPGLAGGGVTTQFLLDSTGLPLRPFVADFDGNGRNDLFALSGLGDRVNLWFAKADGTLAGARNYNSGLPGSSWIEGGDFDGDGDAEILTGSQANTQLSVLGGDGSGGLAVEALVNVGLPVYQIESADLDSDGLPDLVVGVEGGLRLLRNRSTPGSYQFDVLPGSPAVIASSNYPFGIALADFDRDGDFDIAACDYVGGGVHIVPGTPTPFQFGSESVVALGGGPVDVVAADFTGDGLFDLAVSRAEEADIVVLRNDGAAGFSPFLNVPVGQSPNYLVTADFNRDGRADLVVSNANSGTVSVLFGSASGLSGQSYAAGAAPTALLARDLTGDGIVDILVTSLTSGDFRVLVGDGNGSFPLLPTFAGTFGASDAVLQDMNGDGKPDLMISSLITNRVSLVRNIRQ
jgi:FG-GAP-like repeat